MYSTVCISVLTLGGVLDGPLEVGGGEDLVDQRVRVHAGVLHAARARVLRTTQHDTINKYEFS